MSMDWLDPVRGALDAVPVPVVFFFRDDDAGWADAELFALLDLFDRVELPIDLAVIPQALGSNLARQLRVRLEAVPDRIALHQHGFAHTNQEPQGRKCEFGATRSAEDQHRDLEQGRAWLADLLGGVALPIFTPPWNRCTEATGRCLLRLGFRLLSRDATAGSLSLDGLDELPVQFDWLARRDGVRRSLADRGRELAAAVASGEPVGIMLHHAVMDAGDRADLAPLLQLLGRHERARCGSMLQAAGLQAAGALPPATAEPRAGS